MHIYLSWQGARFTVGPNSTMQEGCRLRIVLLAPPANPDRATWRSLQWLDVRPW
jgi:hypothetical protein